MSAFESFQEQQTAAPPALASSPCNSPKLSSPLSLPSLSILLQFDKSWEKHTTTQVLSDCLVLWGPMELDGKKAVIFQGFRFPRETN